MRLPGFINHKAPTAKARIIETNSNPGRSLLADIEENLVEIPLEPTPTQQPTIKVGGLEKTGRARLYAAKWPGVSEPGRNIAAFQHAATLIQDFTLSETEAWPILQEWNTYNKPPLSETELRTILCNGDKYGSPPIGEKLTESRPRPRQYHNAKNALHAKKIREQAAALFTTDLGNSRRLALYYGDEFRYYWDMGAWLYYDGQGRE
ncbi:hypothetical protein ES708_27133 [subsurface metagenome]